MQKDATALAAINMFGVLGALENLCATDEKAAAILRDLNKPVSLCFAVKNGPSATWHFTREGCRMTEGESGCTAKMTFSTPEAFNALIDNAKPGLPVKAPLTTIRFLLGPFTKLTDRLQELLRPSEEALSDRAFFEQSTNLTLYTVAGAISAAANYDPIGRISASNTVDGDVLLGIKDGVCATIRVRDGRFSTVKAACDNPRALMEFATVDLAAGLFAGTVSTIGELCRGNIRIAGMVSMVDNINRILDRVSGYLA